MALKSIVALIVFLLLCIVFIVFGYDKLASFLMLWSVILGAVVILGELIKFFIKKSQKQTDIKFPKWIILAGIEILIILSLVLKLQPITGVWQKNVIEPIKMQQKKIAKTIKKQACEKNNGIMYCYTTYCGIPNCGGSTCQCVPAYKDGGEKCNSKKDCEGKCVLDLDRYINNEQELRIRGLLTGRVGIGGGTFKFTIPQDLRQNGICQKHNLEETRKPFNFGTVGIYLDDSGNGIYRETPPIQ